MANNKTNSASRTSNKQDLTTVIRTEPYVEGVPKNGRVKAGHRVVCPKCNWTSYRYDREVTAEMIRAEHLKGCRN